MKDRALAAVCIANGAIGVASLIGAVAIGFPGAWFFLLVGVGMVWASTEKWGERRLSEV